MSDTTGGPSQRETTNWIDWKLRLYSKTHHQAAVDRDSHGGILARCGEIVK